MMKRKLIYRILRSGKGGVPSQVRPPVAVLLLACISIFATANKSWGQNSRVVETKRVESWYTIYVAPTGQDADADVDTDADAGVGTGTKSQPFRTIAFALRKAREVRRLNQNLDADAQRLGIKILLADGVYEPAETLVIRPEDGGTAGSPTVIAAIHRGKVTISGGRSVKGWAKISASDPLFKAFPKKAVAGIYVASLPDGYGQALNFRQLWVNGRKAIRAESFNGGSQGSNMQRILSWDHKGQSCLIPKPKDFDTSHLKGMEMLIHQWWAVAFLRIKSAKVMGDQVLLHFLSPESRIQSEHPWPAPWISAKTGNSAFYLTGAPGFLDAPGEWYLDRARQKLYYMPRTAEALDRADVVFPYLTTLVRMEGTPEQSVSHVQLEGIQFAYSTWLRPSRKGHVPLQAGMYLLEAYKLQVPGTRDKASLENQAWIGRPPAAVELYYTAHAGVIDCLFQHLASTGLDMVKGTAGSLVEGNLLKDIGGTGIQIGTYSPQGLETHIAYNPVNKGDICRYDTIRNNLVTDVTNEDWGCVGISAGYVQHLRIIHNEIADVSYSGICVGWGWTKRISALSENQVLDNKVTHYAKRMYDVGGLYTLSAQPGTLIEGNYIDSIYKAPYPHDPDHWFYFYLDEGSSYITIKNNWCPALKVMKNANGPGNTWDNNGPQVADSIKNQAGLTAAYQYLLKDKVRDDHWPIQPVPALHNN